MYTHARIKAHVQARACTDKQTHTCTHAHNRERTRMQAFDSKGTGLILNDRFINAPPKLSPPLVMFLMDAIKDRAQSGAHAHSPLSVRRPLRLWRWLHGAPLVFNLRHMLGWIQTL